MSVLNAVALAGGYTFRADQRRVYIRRDGTGKEETLNADQTTRLTPAISFALQRDFSEFF